MKHGQVLEYTISLEQSDLTADLKQQYIIFKNTTTDESLVRIKQLGTQLMYNVVYEGDWSDDMPLTLSDPDQIFNLPQEPARVNDNTYARMDSDFKLYDQGDQYIRLANDPPTLYVSNNINFRLEGAGAPIATMSSTGLSMNSNKITNLANPTSALDAVNRQYLEKFDTPIGVVQAYYANSVPAGWLYCNGSAFNQATYPELFALLGNSNVLPDLRGYFLRGTSDSNAVDPSGPRNAGNVQADALGSHTHAYEDAYFAEHQGGGQNLWGNSGDVPDADNDVYTRNGTTGATGASETRPKNVAVRYIIKALPSGRI